MNKLTFAELERRKDWTEAVIVFTEASFKEIYPLEARSYQIFADAKYFNPNMNGTSLYGYALDGSDQGVRLDWYWRGTKDNWQIEYCYILK
jgi:hypothetical protein